MKRLNLIVVSLLFIAAFVSCDDKAGPVMSSDPGSPTLTSPESGESYTLSQENEEESLLTIEWSEPDFGFPAAPSYTVEMDTEGNEFADPMEITSVEGTTSYELIVGEFNNRLLSAGFEGDQSHSMELRVVASVSDSVSEAISDPVTVSFTPYTVEIDLPQIYVPGGYQSASGYGNDWTPEDAPPLFSFNDDDTYEGYVYIANDGSEFKFTNERNWEEGDWGTSGTEGELESPGNNIVADEGYYKINVDLNEMTYETLDTQWGLIGDATADGWDADQDMTYDSDEKVWTITTDLSEGEIKFRANDTWEDVDYGDSDGDGTLEQGGDNIPVEEAGNYTVTLDLSEAPYSYSLEQN